LVGLSLLGCGLHFNGLDNWTGDDGGCASVHRSCATVWDSRVVSELRRHGQGWATADRVPVGFRERGQRLMRAKSVATWLLFGVTILSLPLCLVPIILWGGAAVPWMVADFTVANHSGETVYITPVTISPVAVLQRYSVGQLRAFRQVDIRLPAGESIRISYDAESGRPGAIAVRNEVGDYRQLALDKGVRTLISGPEIIYTLGSFDTLPPIDQWVLHTARRATPFNLDLRYWGSMLIGTLAGGIPIGLFGVWSRLVRRQREGHNLR